MPLAPEYEAMFSALAAEPGPKISELSPAQGREMYRLMRAVNPELSIGSVEDRQIETEAGSLPIRIYRPAAEGGHTKNGLFAVGAQHLANLCAFLG